MGIYPISRTITFQSVYCNFNQVGERSECEHFRRAEEPMTVLSAF